jgi:hypothetical protein
MSILDSYVLKPPTNQNIIDIFKGEWSSKFPAHFHITTEPGSAALFEDARVIWAEQALGSFKDMNILELGPLEGGHSYMLQHRNASKITAIEANTRSFLKCLCVKEVLKLDKVEFMLGDFMDFLKIYNSLNSLNSIPLAEKAFDREYYLNTYTDIGAAEIDPYFHYINYGWKEGRNPNKWFDTLYYLRTNTDIKTSDIEPLTHYITIGKNEGRKPAENSNVHTDTAGLKFDIVFASGVLYHMNDPIELLKLMSEVSDKVFIWTHYYDETVISNNEVLKLKFEKVETKKYGEFMYQYCTQSYNDALGWEGFCGGPKPTSKWLTKESLLGALKQFGFNDIQINFEKADHQNGPSIAICAKKKQHLY